MYYNELIKEAADLLAIARAERTYAAAFDAVDAAESALAAAEDDDDIERAERMVRRAYGIKADAEAENESGDLVTAAAAAVKGAQADHDAASTPNARAITLLRLREARNWMAQVQQELERTEAMADSSPLVRYLPYSPPALPWTGTGTALILEEDALVTRAASGALIVGNPPDAK